MVSTTHVWSLASVSSVELRHIHLAAFMVVFEMVRSMMKLMGSLSDSLNQDEQSTIFDKYENIPAEVSDENTVLPIANFNEIDNIHPQLLWNIKRCGLTMPLPNWTDLMSCAHTGVSEMINNFVFFLAPPPHAPPPRPNVSHPSLSETAHEADEKKNSTYAQRTFPEIMFLQELDHDHIIRMMNVMKDENDSCVAMSKTDGISRGIGVDNTGADISVPV
eukprot:268711_1